MLNTVKVPPQYEPVFEKAQEYVSKYFNSKKEDPTKGTIDISGERYILVRAASMSIDFFEIVRNLYKSDSGKEAENVARQLLFDIAHAIGKEDARNFHKKMGLKDPIEKLSVGPVHFSHSGWAFVDIFPESKPSTDENCFLIYDHTYSFEAEAWEKAGKKSDFPVCIMNAGYSSGWCEESFGIPLITSEIMCKAKGDSACRFIMAHPAKIEDYIREYAHKEPGLEKKITTYHIPGFFERKKIEEVLNGQFRFLQNLIDAIPVPVFYKDRSGLYQGCNRAFESFLGLPREKILGRSAYDVSDKNLADRHRDADEILFNNPGVQAYEVTVQRGDATKSEVIFNKATYTDPSGKAIGIIGVIQDITERKQMEEELKKKIHYLEIFNKASVDRELKISELKKKIDELSAQLSKG